jgi:hypothetical protein
VLTIHRLGPPTALVVLAITLILLHGVTNWIPVLRWFPIWISLTLLASVNIAPRVIETLYTLGAGFSALAELGIRSGTRTGQEIDLEQRVGLLQEMAELPNAGHQSYEEFDLLLGHMDHLPEAEDPELAEESPDSLSLDSGSVSTSPAVRRLMQHFNQMPSQVSQNTVCSAIDPMPRQSMSFPQTSEDQHLLDLPLVRSTSSSRTEESSLVHMIPGGL